MYKKKLMEERQDLLDQMTAIKAGAESEERAFTDEENAKFKDLEAQIGRIDASLRAIDAQRDLMKRAEVSDPAEDNEPKETVEQMELRAFANIIRQRSDSNITKTDNGAVIPKTIAKRIIDKVKDISPLFARSEHYDIKGTVSIPYVDSDNDNITVEYADEFKELESKSAKIAAVDLSGFLTGALTKVSRSLMNSTDIDLVAFVVRKMAESVAAFIDSEILNGTQGKVKPLATVDNAVTAGSATALIADDLIRVQGKLKSVFQTNAIWVMHPDTLTAIRMLKDANGRYLFNDNIVQGFSGTILGKLVYTSDQAPQIGASATPVLYIDSANALASKVVEDSVQILTEKYATQHAIGVVDWFEFDVKLVNQQAVAMLKMAEA